MSVVWSMTSLESGRFSAGDKCLELSNLADDFNALRSRGQGYLEVRLPGDSFPQMTLGFRGDYAIIHLFSDGESVSLLIGDGTVPSEAMVEVPIMDDLAVFSGEFVLSVDRAWEAVQKFARAGIFEDLGEWCEL
jgi:hypothetical protein